jgi:hypothetical protein
MFKITQAFEERWSELRAKYPTTSLQDAMIIHAMDRLVGDHKVVNGIAETLPIELRALFRELAQVYLKEQRLNSVKVEEPCMADTLIIDQPTWLHSNETNSNEQEISSLPSKDAAGNKILAVEQGAIPVVDQPDSLYATPQSMTQAAHRVKKPNPLDPLIGSQSPNVGQRLEPDSHHPQIDQPVATHQKPQANPDEVGKIGLRNQTFSHTPTARRSPNSLQQPEPNLRRSGVATLEDENIAEIFRNKRSQNSARKSQRGVLQRLLNLMFGWIGQ